MSRSETNPEAAAAPLGRKLIRARDVATICESSLAAVWKGVAAGRLPAPVYPTPRSPRWYLDEVHAALAATRALPAEAKAARRAAKLSAPR